jgi:hypothetical protein
MSEWYYTTNKQQMGPVSWDELRELAEVGILKPHDMVWSEGMDEWVKAINQSGLFGDGNEALTDAKAKKKPSYGDAPKPPPGRRTRKKEEEEEEEEEDDKDDKRKARKREEDRAKWGVGFRVALGIGAVVGLLLLGSCVCGGIAYMTWGGADAPRPAPGPIAGPGPGPNAGGLVRDDFAWNNLRERFHMEKSYRFTAGKRVVITVNNNLPNPNTNVDVMVFRGGGMNQNQNTAFQWDRRTPQQDRNCRLDFIVPANDTYWVRVVNFGPGMANACQVSVVEQ